MMRTATIIGVVWACVAGGVWAGQGDEEWVGENAVWEGQGWRQWEEGVRYPGEVMYEGIMELGRQSTVYTFNFNNLLVIFALKLLVLVAMSGGFGFFYGRSLDGGAAGSWVDEKDMLFMTTYLVSDGIQRYDCLNRLACLDDQKAQQLLTAAKMMIKGAKYIRPFMGFSLEKYERMTEGMEEAIYHRHEGGSCRARYQCHAIPSL